MITPRFSKIISHTLHPIVFPIIGVFLYFIFIPRYISSSTKRTLLISIFISTYILPIVFMYLIKRLKFIDSYYLKTIEERKFPLLFFTILSYLLGILLYRIHIVPGLALFFFGVTLTLLIAYLLTFVNFKISLHTMGIGGLIGFLGLLSYTYEVNLIGVIAFFFVIAGYIASSRLKLEAHEEKEVYFGFIVGLAMQLIVYSIYNM